MIDDQVHDADHFDHDEDSTANSRQLNWMPFLFGIFFLLLNFQTITYLGLEKEDLESTKLQDSQIRYYHFFSLVFALPLMRWLPSLRLPWPAILYFVSAIGTALLASYVNKHFSGRNLTLVFAAYSLLLGLYFARIMSPQKLEKYVRVLFLWFSIAVFAKLFYYLAISGGGLPRNEGGRPNITFFSAGGNNLEVTWLALSSVFFVTRLSFYPVAANCVLMSSLYLSRVGLIVVGAAAVFKFLRVRPVVSLLVLGVTGPLLAILLATTVNWSSSEVVERFLNIGDKEEYGSQSRLEIWIATIDAIRAKPWGYGVGSGMEEVKDILTQTVHQNNVHNIFLQMVLDCGVHTLICFLILVFHVARTWYLNGAKNPFGTFFLLFLLPGLIEFTGQESLVWMFVGMFYGTVKAEEEQQALADDEYEEEQPDDEAVAEASPDEGSNSESAANEASTEEETPAALAEKVN